MRFVALSISNFRAITHVELQSLGDTVVIAGPNGCGKSCIFDAIKMLKSAYGDYQPNEWQTWMSESQININRKDSDLSVLLQDKGTPLRVAAEIGITPGEREYLRSNAEDFLAEQAWNEVAPRERGRIVLSVAASDRVHGPEIARRVAEALPNVLTALERDTFLGEVRINPDGTVIATQSLALELIFGTYDSQNIGVIDYHGANRNYAREQVASVNLNLASSEEKLRQHALYNYAGKYANLKTELASSYVRHLLAREADSSAGVVDTLNATMKELFDTFFPGKTFLGPTPRPDGGLSFPVRTSAGAEHDIDELSSGEKEVLYGYLRIKNAAPKQSVLLIDEPELHLNPRLVKGLASFYHRHLGKALGNQVWLVTHSDALIREAVGQQSFSTFHMQPAGQYSGANQVSAVTAGQALERLIIDLVGDLATYRPNAKIVLFEGGGDREFDVRMTCDLFPKFETSVNPISAGNKARVTQLYELLDRARQEGHLPAKFYAITDSDGEQANALAGSFQWDVYHIENYLLSPPHILRVLQELHKDVAPVDSERGVLDLLAQAARLTIPSFLSHELTTYASKAIVDCVNFGFDPLRTDVAAALSEAIERAKTKINATPLSKEILAELQGSKTKVAEADLKSGRWKSTYRGRDVLHRFCDLAHLGVPYEAFRDLIIARMKDTKYEPPGMRDVIEKILLDE